MTLIITIISPLFVIQAGDRLLTTQSDGKTEQFDEKSNKSVIYEATNGLLTISYCGAAFVRGKPTDEWIAEQLESTLKIPMDGSDPSSMQFGTLSDAPRLSFDKVIKRLRDKLATLSSSELRHAGITIVIAGWKLKREKWKRVLVELTRLRGSTGLNKPVGFRQRPGIKGNCGVDLVGSGNRKETVAYFDAQWASIHQRGTLPDVEAYEKYVTDVRDAMVATIKFASSIEDTVGANVHTATIYEPKYFPTLFCETHFFNDMPHPAVIQTPRRTVPVPDAGVTGWVLFPGLLRAPSYLVGTEQINSPLTTLISNGAPPQFGVGHFMQTVPRRRIW
jgi:hypothetical protein